MASMTIHFPGGTVEHSRTQLENLIASIIIRHIIIIIQFVGGAVSTVTTTMPW